MEKISEIRNKQRKEEEEEDDDGPIKIFKNEDVKLDMSDIQTIEKPVNLNDHVLDIEVLQ